jgi:hypothetical protein
MKKSYPKKVKKAFQPLFNSDGTINLKNSQYAQPTKLNKANFMSKEDWAKSEYATMDKNDFEEERQRDMRATKSF